jgi:GT2 family glycosyltransferase
MPDPVSSVSSAPLSDGASPVPPPAARVALPAQPEPHRNGRAAPAVVAEPADVSVCIANWNCRAYLRACLESLYRRPQGVRLETVVVDNGSTDGAADMVAREFPEVVLLRNPSNAGFARASNQAARAARGRYLFFLNNDTVLPPGTLARLLDHAQRHPEVGLIGPLLRDGQGVPQISYRLRPTMATFLHRTSLLRWTRLFRRSYRRYRREGFDPQTTRPVEILMGAAMFLPRDVFFASGSWDEEYTFGGEDLDLSTQVAKRHTVVYLPQVEITHYGRVSTRQHIGYASSNMAAGFVRFFRKTGCPRRALWAYKVIVTLDIPLQLVGKAVQYGTRRLRGQPDRARKSLLAMKGMWHFLVKGLVPFWKA